jgi:hypothetical protein
MSLPRKLLQHTWQPWGTHCGDDRCWFSWRAEATMARAGLLWLLGIPIPILLLMWVFGWLH